MVLFSLMLSCFLLFLLLLEKKLDPSEHRTFWVEIFLPLVSFDKYPDFEKYPDFFALKLAIQLSF